MEFLCPFHNVQFGYSLTVLTAIKVFLWCYVTLHSRGMLLFLLAAEAGCYAAAELCC